MQLNVRFAYRRRGGKGAYGRPAALRWSGLRCASAALRCSVSWPRRRNRFVRCAHCARTAATSQLTIRAARAATRPALLIWTPPLYGRLPCGKRVLQVLTWRINCGLISGLWMQQGARRAALLALMVSREVGAHLGGGFSAKPTREAQPPCQPTVLTALPSLARLLSRTLLGLVALDLYRPWPQATGGAGGMDTHCRSKSR